MLTDENLQKRNESTTYQGQSLFLPIPEDRTCEAAHIHKNYCTCNGQGYCTNFVSFPNFTMSFEVFWMYVLKHCIVCIFIKSFS